MKQKGKKRERKEEKNRKKNKVGAPFFLSILSSNLQEPLVSVQEIGDDDPE